ncbi:MAG: MurR/RpiR family transcriptional regulator [Clostridiales bacterium]|nr:MurR/RpiR family transcriptional regulator [Clostridiales bacterium]
MNEQLELAIREIYAALRKSEKKAADYLLSYQGSFRELTLEKIAEEAEVSQPTVLRFIRAMGYKGYKEFRYVLADEQENQQKDKILNGFGITKEDKVGEMPAKIIGTSISQMKDTLKQISPEKLERVVKMIKEADRIAVYYVENSSCTANDLVTKLMYLGINCYVYPDYYMQSVSASNLGKNDLAIGISYSGSSKSTVEVMHTAQKSGAKTIAITNFENALINKYSDLVLSTSNKQFIYGDAIFSRVSQLAVVDMIYTGILLSDYEKYTRILDKNSRIIQKLGYEER